LLASAYRGNRCFLNVLQCQRKAIKRNQTGNKKKLSLQKLSCNLKWYKKKSFFFESNKEIEYLI